MTIGQLAVPQPADDTLTPDDAPRAPLIRGFRMSGRFGGLKNLLPRRVSRSFAVFE